MVDLHGLGMEAFEEVFALDDLADVEIEGLGDLLFGDATFEGFHDHPVLLNEGETVDLVVVGEGVVVGRDEARGGGTLQFLEGFEAEVSIEEEVGAFRAFVGMDHQRLDESDGAD